MADTAIFDVDGTLVDTNYQHALAWYRAFRRHGITRPLWRIHRGIGMGGDTFVPEVAGPDVEERLGDALREAWTEEFDQLIGEVQPFEGARDLLEEVRRRRFFGMVAGDEEGRAPHQEGHHEKGAGDHPGPVARARRAGRLARCGHRGRGWERHDHHPRSGRLKHP